jgi:hypothetical protein
MHWFDLPARVSDLLYREYVTARLEVVGFEQRHYYQAVRELSLAHWVLIAELDDGMEKPRRRDGEAPRAHGAGEVPAPAQHRCG